MRFINPKTDFAFKKIFGSAQSKPILLSFLNAVLHGARPVIVDLEIIDPYLAPKIRGMKDTFVDVRARLQDGRTVIIEMQVLNDEGFEKRVLYNAAKAYSTQLLIGDNYKDLSAVVALTITDFVMFPEHREVQSAYVLREKQRLTDYPEGDLELVFVELPKFGKTLEELADVKEKWLFFLCHAPDLQMVPEPFAQDPAFNTAFEIANQANMTAEELDIQERKLRYINQPRSAIKRARREAETIGIAKGEAIGESKKAREIALRLLAQMTDEQIAGITGLPVAEVAALRKVE
jgi:predicted transposase/invertase (TIGR01784 family)